MVGRGGRVLMAAFVAGAFLIGLFPVGVRVMAQTPLGGSVCGVNVVPNIAPVNAIASDNERTYVSLAAEVAAYSTDFKRLQWLTEVPRLLPGRIVVGSTDIFVLADADAGVAMLLLDKLTGLVRKRLAFPNLKNPKMTASESFVVVVQDRHAFVVDLRGNSEPTSFSFKSSVKDLFVSDRNLLFAISETEIEQIDLKDGSRQRPVGLKGRQITTLTDSPLGFVLGTRDGSISLWRSLDRSVKWRFRAGGRIVAVSQIDDDIIAASHDNFIYRISSGNGAVEWKKRVGGRIVFAPALSNGLVIVTDASSGFVESIDAETGRTLTRLKLGDDLVPTMPPVSSGDFSYVVTTAGLFSFGMTGCK